MSYIGLTVIIAAGVAFAQCQAQKGILGVALGLILIIVNEGRLRRNNS